MKTSLSKRSSFVNEDFSEFIRQARFKINDSNRESCLRFAENDERALYKKFIKENFHSIECRHFFKADQFSNDDNSKCRCGELKTNHKSDKISFCLSESWNENKSMEILPTDSFGKIEFIGEDITNSKLTDFVRVSYVDKFDDVLELLFNKWNISVGNLCISVIGGTVNFKMRKKEKNIFCQGLIKAAKTTNALIITSGLNKGITSVIGDAIQYSQSYLYDKMKHNNFISCLGIAPWGYVKNRHILEFAKGSTVQYNVINETESNQSVSLNKNHTHYLFFDDGYRLDKSKSKMIYFRQALEKKISQKLGSREAIPVVLLIVEGGHEIFIEGSKRIKENVPLIICVGTGQASNILGEVFQENSSFCHKRKRIRSGETSILSETYRKILRKKLVEQNISESHEVDEAIKCIEDIIKNEFLITLFDIKSHQSLDFAILQSLIKRMDYLCDCQHNALSSQLSLCLIWNRIDILKDKIFSGDISLSNNEWIAFFMESIMKGRIDFIELFLENILDLDNFLTPSILKDLYETYSKSTNFRKTFLRLTGRSFSKGISDVKELVFKMIGVKNKPSIIIKEDMMQPFQELFLWSVLMEKHKCAKFFWEKCDDALCFALVATRIYKCLRGTSIRDTDRQQTLKVWKDNFENLAVKLIEEYHDIDQETAAYLVEKEISIFGDITCLELANKSDDLKFISNIVCQNSIDFTWRAGFNISFYDCILCILLPFLILIRKRYTKDFETDKLYQNQEFVDFNERKYISLSNSKLKRFYTAPQTKFVIHSFTFTSFLVYFSYVVLYGMKRMMLSTHEVIFIIYLVLMILETLIEMFQSKSYRIYDQVKYWWKFNYWNKLDAIIIILALNAMILRYPLVMNPMNTNRIIIFQCSKTLYSLIVGMFYIKFLRLLTFHKKLGPKMVMMIELVKQLMIYLIVIIIFLASYGVTSQAGYYTQRDFTWSGLSNLFQYPYYTMLGVILSKNNVYLTWCDPNMNGSDSNDCPEQNVLIPILFAAYVMISNLLIVNILVATNSYVCEDIHKDSIDIWKCNKYLLLLEYKKKQIIPLPFSIIIYICKLITACYRKSTCYHLKNYNLSHVQSINKTKNIKKRTISDNVISKSFCETNLDSKLNKKLKYYENYSQKSVMKDISTKKQKSIESRISRIEQKMKTLVKEMDSIYAKLNEIQLKKAMIAHNLFEKSSRQIIKQTNENLYFSKESINSTETLLSKIKENAVLLMDDIKKRNQNRKVYNPARTIGDNKISVHETSVQTVINAIHCQNVDKSTFNPNEIIKHAIINEFTKKSYENSQIIRKLDEKIDQLKFQTNNFIHNFESFIESF